MKTVQPNAEQKRWREIVRGLGMGEIIHHATDRTRQIKGIGNIGHWWLVPCVSDQDHRDIHAMGKARKSYEKFMFNRVCRFYRVQYNQPLPLPDGVYKAIMRYSV